MQPTQPTTPQPILGFEHYTISPDGTVTNLRTGRQLKPSLNYASRYFLVTLSDAGKSRKFYLHRLLAQTFLPNPTNLPCVDHVDRCKTNNSLGNLRWASHSENQQNVTKHKVGYSKYLGVSWSIRAKKWVSAIWLHGRNTHLGCFDCEFAAARAYNAAAETHGFLSRNILPDEQPAQHSPTPAPILRTQRRRQPGIQLSLAL